MPVRELQNSSTGLQNKAGFHFGNSILATVTSLVVVAIVIRYMYVSMFFGFRPYDDEGLVSFCLKNYCNGAVLYDELLTQYGPTFFLLLSGLHSALAWQVSHDSMRSLSLIFWFGGSCGLTFATFRITRSLQLAITAFVTIALTSQVIANEPGHPQGLLFLISSLIVLLQTMKRNLTTAIGLAFLVATACTIKLNVGGLLLLSVVWPAIECMKGHRRRLLQGAFRCILLSVPFLLMRPLLAHSAYLLFTVLTTALIAILSHFFARETRLPNCSVRWTALFLIASTSFGLSALLIPLTRGTSLAGLWYGLVGQHLSMASEFFVAPPQIGIIHIILSGTAMLLMVSFPSFLSAIREEGPKIPNGLRLIKLLLGLTVILSPFLFETTAIYSIALCLCVLPRKTAMPEDAESIRVRYSLLSMTFLLMLQIYPVAGSQLGMAFVSAIPLGCIIVKDAIGESLLTKSPPQLSISLTWQHQLLTVLTAIVLCLFSMEYISKEKMYRNAAQPVHLLGASRLRMDEAKLSQLETICINAQAQGDELFTIPGLYSFHLWTGLACPTLLNQTNWPMALNEDEQRVVTTTIASTDNLTIIKSDKVLNFWNRSDTPRDSSTIEFISQNFVPSVTVEDYLLLHRPRHKVRAFGVHMINNKDTKKTNDPNILYLRVPPLKLAPSYIEICDAKAQILATKTLSSLVVPQQSQVASTNQSQHTYSTFDGQSGGDLYLPWKLSSTPGFVRICSSSRRTIMRLAVVQSNSLDQ